MRSRSKPTTISLLLLACCATILASSCRKEVGPEEVVRTHFTLCTQEKWDEAFALVDFHAKATSMFGDIYLQGPPEQQKKTQDVLRQRLQDSTVVYMERYFANGPGKFDVSTPEEAKAEVIQSSGGFQLVYLLEKGTDGWRIMDRTHEVDGVRPSVSRGVSLILSRLRKELGREPTLEDLNENLHDYLARSRVRRIKL